DAREQRSAEQQQRHADLERDHSWDQRGLFQYESHFLYTKRWVNATGRRSAAAPIPGRVRTTADRRQQIMRSTLSTKRTRYRTPDDIPVRPALCLPGDCSPTL